MSTSLGFLRSSSSSHGPTPASLETSPSTPHASMHPDRAGKCTFLMGLVLLVGIGFGAGWGIGRGTDNGRCITVADIDKAQAAWAGAVVAIGDAWLQEGCPGALREANGALDAAYSFDRPLLFKPTLTVPPHTFRRTRAGALSYFVGACAPVVTGTDNGFALGYSVADVSNQSTWQGFSSVVFSNMTYHTNGAFCDGALAQGHMTYRSRFNDQDYTVDKSFAYVQNPHGGIPLLTLHHSSVEL